MPKPLQDKADAGAFAAIRRAGPTSGPWLAVFMPDGEGGEYFDGFIHPLPDGEAEDVDVGLRENAALIAAAPELLEVARRSLAMVSKGYGPPDWDWIRSVIAKAEGRQC